MVDPDRSVVVGRAQEQERRRHRPGVPAKAASCGPRFSPVPPNGSLNPADVVQLGLDLGAQEAVVTRPIGKEIDPTSESTGPDLDLDANVPAVPPKATVGVRNTAPMDQVSLLAAAGESERPGIERRADPEEAERCGRKTRVQVRREPRLQTLNGRLAASEAGGQLALAPTCFLARGPDHGANVSAEILIACRVVEHAC